MEPPPLPPKKAARPSNGRWITVVFNAYLVCFAADGIFTLTRKATGEGLHALTGSLAMLMALLIILIAGSYKKLPWLSLLPALLFSFWEGCFFMPLPAFMELDALASLVAVLKITIGAGTFWAVRKGGGGSSWTYRHSEIEGREFSMQRTVKAGLLKLFVLLPIFMGYIAWSAQVMVKRWSAGFVQISSAGLFTEARIYENEGRKIYLLPSVHIASPEFYESLMSDLPAEQTVIFPEGVTDNNHLMKVRADYSNAADAVGLHAQPDLTKRHKKAAVRHCDADISDFAPSTVTALNGVFGALQAASAGDTLSALQSIQSISDPDTETIIRDILETRNKRVVEGLKEALPHFNHIAIPWGAAHMPGIERELIKMHASFKEGRRIQVLKWNELKLFPQNSP